ncbi:MarR family transcriptional regulator [Acinetobacter calcoaceticus]|uniref:MarR family transcriptional regulator n=1 Tax=Acinetobacter calcoaceticus TaxID=471 RepID=A0A4R1XFJ4_ACICA|nr:MarR family transcriptional regulator [Acinetobacter calcoaceticus]
MEKIDFLLQQNHIGSLIGKNLDLALSVHGINSTEFTVMYHLNNAQENKLSRIALAGKVALTASGITRVLLPMEKIGLVEKNINPRDARQSLVSLTQSGLQIVEDAMITVEHTAERFFSLLNEDEISTLFSLLNRIKI